MDLSRKVALVTGGASGIGESCVEELLRNGIKGVIVVDINEKLGDEVTKKFNEKYGKNRTIFVKTDVSDQNSFENALERGVETYNNLDILVNCAGIANEIMWEKTLHINLFGTTYGCLLAINKYFPKYKSGAEAYIININSTVSLMPIGFYPHYSSSKSAIIALTRSFGVNKTTAKAGVYVMAICPGGTDTSLLNNVEERIVYKEQLQEALSELITQKVSSVAKGLIYIIREPKNGRVLVVNEDKMYDVAFPELQDMLIPIPQNSL